MSKIDVPGTTGAHDECARLRIKGASMTRLLLRVHEAADMLGISRSKAYSLIASGELPSIRLGSSVRVPLRSLELMIEQQEQEDAAGAGVAAAAGLGSGELRKGLRNGR